MLLSKSTPKRVSAPRTDGRVPLLLLMASALVLGLLAGYVDIHSSSQWLVEVVFYLLLSAVFTYLRPRLFWLWPLIWAFTLYAVHIYAIRHGYQQPYVEKSEEDALSSLIIALPAFFGSLIGAEIRWGLSQTTKI